MKIVKATASFLHDAREAIWPYIRKEVNWIGVQLYLLAILVGIFGFAVTDTTSTSWLFWLALGLMLGPYVFLVFDIAAIVGSSNYKEGLKVGFEQGRVAALESSKAYLKNKKIRVTYIDPEDEEESVIDRDPMVDAVIWGVVQAEELERSETATTEVVSE